MLLARLARRLLGTLALATLLAPSTQAAVPASQRSALLALYDSTGGTAWTNRTNWSGAPGTECTWYGIRCDAAATSVEQILLPDNNLAGTLPPDLGSISTLRFLDLRSNRLTGTIPAQLGQLVLLAHLLLSSNQLSGSIPPELAAITGLSSLDLANNKLTGTIPPALLASGALPLLFELDLSGNALSGSIPREISNLRFLLALRLSGNGFHGNIPAEIGGLPNLQLLLLNENGLTGPIPPELGNLSSLSALSLAGNELTGEIPESLGNLSNLVELDLSANELSGGIPAGLGRLSSLETLDLHFNGLSGRIPPELGGITPLRQLDLRFNSLSGGIPPWLGKLANLVVLDLAVNELGGTIPIEVFDLRKLRLLDLSFNQLSGVIPPQVGQLPELEVLGLEGNALTGGIPPEIGTLKKLRWLGLLWNELTGVIPPQLSQPPDLYFLSLGHNHLSGNIPAALWSMPALVWLDVSGNKLTGSLPAAVGDSKELIVLDVSDNALSGRLPPEITRVTTLHDGSSDFRHNAFFTDDPAVRNFVNAKQLDNDWESTQTVPVTNPRVVAARSDTIVVAWDRIAFSGGNGGYRVSASTSPGGSPVRTVSTPDLTFSSAAVNGLAPLTTYYFEIRTVSVGDRVQQNTITSDPAPIVSGTTTASVPSAAQVVVTSYPFGIVQPAELAGLTDYYVIQNAGDFAAPISIGREGTFFSQSPTTLTLAPGAEQVITLTAAGASPGVYNGASIVTGTGVPAGGLKIPVRLLVVGAQSGTAIAEPDKTRIDVSAPAGTNPTGSVVFTNIGTGTLQGIATSNAGWIIPDSGLVTIVSGGSATVGFRVDRALRPDGGAPGGTATGSLSLVYATGPAPLTTLRAGARNPAGTSGVAASLVSVIDTVRPASLPPASGPLGPGEVAILLPGVGHVLGGVGLFLSDLTVTNTFGINSIADITMLFTPAMDQAASASTASVGSIAPATGVRLADVVKSVFNAEQSTGTLLLRTRDFDKLLVSSNIFNVSNPAGTYGTVIPSFRTDRSLAPGQELWLTGLRKSDTMRTNLFVQEASGRSATFRVEFFDAGGRLLSSLDDSTSGFRMLRLLDRVPEGTITARVTNSMSSTGRLVAYATPVDQASGDFWSVVDWSLQLGAERSESALIPVAGTVRGANDTYFRTDAAICNTGTADASVTLRYHARDGSEIEKRVRLGKGESREYLDVVGNFFGAPAGSLGYVVVIPELSTAVAAPGAAPGPEPAKIAATSRTYATVGSQPGTFGTGVPTVPLSRALRLGQSRLVNGIEITSVATTVAGKPGTFRTNIGLIETAGRNVTVRVSVLYGDTRSLVFGPLTTFDVALAPNESRLITDLSSRIPATARGEDLRSAALKLEVVSGEGAAVVYTSSVDNGSGDSLLRTE